MHTTPLIHEHKSERDATHDRVNPDVSAPLILHHRGVVNSHSIVPAPSLLPADADSPIISSGLCNPSLRAARPGIQRELARAVFPRARAAFRARHEREMQFYCSAGSFRDLPRAVDRPLHLTVSERSRSNKMPPIDAARAAL